MGELDAFDYDGQLDVGAGDPAAELITITNPPGTVSISAMPDGHIATVSLNERVTWLSETELADEILVIAGLAYQHARSAQYTALLGHWAPADRADAHEFLTRNLELPSPDQAARSTARVFANRYAEPYNCGPQDD